MRLLLILASIFIISGCDYGKKKPDPPRAQKISKELTIHDHMRIDNYYWLKERDNKQVISYLEAENDYTAAALKHTASLQQMLFDEIVGRIKQTDESVPVFKNGYHYYTRYASGQEHPIYCRKKASMDADEEVMLDVNEMAKGHDYYSVRGVSVSPDNKYVAFGVDTLSRRKYTIHIKDLDKEKIFSDGVPNTTGAPVWANDNSTIFYARRDHTLRPYKIFSHILQTAEQEDKEVYHEADETFSTGIRKSKSDRFIFIVSNSTLSTETRFIDANRPEQSFQIIHPREKDHEYSVAHFEDNFYLLTNFGAKNFRLMRTPVVNTAKQNWTEVITHRDDVLLEKIEVFKDFLVLQERYDALRHMRIIRWSDRSEHELQFEEPAYTASISRNPEFDTPWLRFTYTSLTTPNSTYDYHMVDKNKKLLKRSEVVGDFDPENYTTERLHATAKDGTKIPVSLVYKTELKNETGNPLLLVGYGSYGSSYNPRFNSVRLSLIDRGFIYAIAHIRGGQEKGRDWYEDGKLLNKKNTFTDFIDCGEHLVKIGYTDTKRLTAIGGSAGGLLIGAVVNMRPDLFRAAIAAVPFVDVITTMLDPDIPLTTSEYDEWGNPNDKTYYEYILSYSPYDNVEAKDYPAMLVTTGLHDSQVQYWEPAKWVAKLREYKTDNNLLILQTDMETGHSGAAGRFKRHKMTALEYAFLLDQLGIE